MSSTPRDSKLLVFNYHNLLEANDNTGRIGLSRKSFEDQVRWIAHNFEVIGLREGIEGCAKHTLKRPSACITFDDGYRTQMIIGARLLDELGITASFFVTTGHLGDAMLWNDRLRRFLHLAGAEDRLWFLSELEKLVPQESRPIEPASDDEIERLVKYLPIKRRQTLLLSLSSHPSSHAVGGEMLHEEDLRNLHSRGFEIGAHTLEHPILMLENATESRRQIALDLENLKRILGEAPTCFAFPNGMPGVDFSRRDLDVLAELGVLVALTSGFGHFDGNQDPLQVPRLSLRGSSGLDFLRTVAAAYRVSNHKRSVLNAVSGVKPLDPSASSSSVAGARRPHVQMVSYHFAPSVEVGAKRPTATAHHLASRFDISVVRASEVSSSSVARVAGNQTTHGFRTVLEVPCSSLETFALTRVLRSTLVCLYYQFRRSADDSQDLKTQRKTDSRDAEAVLVCVDGDTTPNHLIDRAVDLYRGINGLLQNKKIWLLRASLLVSRAAMRSSPDIVIASGPPMVSLVLGGFAARIAGARLILDFRDPWYVYGEREHVELNWGRVSPTASRIERSFLARCVSRADAIVVASPGIRDHLHSLGILRDRTPVHVVRNGYEPEMLIEVPPPTGRLEILYTGSLYWNRNPFPFLEALGRFVERADVDRSLVRFRMLGRCEQWGGIELKPWIVSRGLEDVVSLEGLVSVEDVRKATLASNLLVNFAQGQPRQIPAKSYEYIASQRAVLLVAEGESDVAALFREASAGSIVEPGDPIGLDAALVRAWDSISGTSDQPEFNLVDVHRFSRQVQVKEFEKIVLQVLENTSGDT